LEGERKEEKKKLKGGIIWGGFRMGGLRGGGVRLRRLKVGRRLNQGEDS